MSQNDDSKLFSDKEFENMITSVNSPEDDINDDDKKNDKEITLKEYLKDDVTEPIEEPEQQEEPEQVNEDEGIPLNKYLDDEPEDNGDISDHFPSVQDDNKQVIEYKDASSVVARILAPQLATDRELLDKGIIDIRRLTNVTKIEQLWLSFFMHLPSDQGGGWMQAFCGDYMNLAPSLNGMRVKLLVAMQAAIGGLKRGKDKAKDNRSFFERHLTKRNQEPEDVLDVGV